MLLVSRRVDESVYIYPDEQLPKDMTVAELFAGGKISIEVKEISGNQVRFGINAPKNLTILRNDAKSVTK